MWAYTANRNSLHKYKTFSLLCVVKPASFCTLCYALLTALIFEIHCTGDKTMWIHPKIVKVKSLKSQTILVVLMSHVNTMTLMKFIGCFTFPPLAGTGTLKSTREAYFLIWYAALCSAQGANGKC